MTEKLNVLYVEDHLDTIESMNIFMKTTFNKIYTCNNGEDALNTYKEIRLILI